LVPKSLTPEALAALRSRHCLIRQLGIRSTEVEQGLEAEGAPPDAFLHMALILHKDPTVGMRELLKVRRARGISWETVGQVLCLNGIAPVSAVAWEPRSQKQAGRVLGVPNWFLEGCLQGGNADRGKGNLCLRDLAHVRELPENLLLGNLELTNLQGLTHLPSQACIQGEVIFDRLPGVSTWPEWLQQCRRRVMVRNCPGLGILPMLNPPPSLCLDHQPFPRGLLPIGALKYLELCQLPDLRHLPESLEVNALGVCDCDFLESVPRQLRNSSSNGTDRGRLDPGFKIQRCAGLQRLPDQADYPSHLKLDRCLNLRSLGADLRVGGNLSLTQLPCLERLPDGLHVPGTLHLEDLAALSDLGEGLVVEGNLVIWNLPSLACLPHGLKVGRDLILGNSACAPAPAPDLDVQGRIHLHPRFLDLAWPASLRRKITLESFDSKPTAQEEMTLRDFLIPSRSPRLQEAGP